MKIQLAYRVTGEDRNKVIEDLKKITQSLKEAGHEPYCPALDLEAPKGEKELFKHALNKLDGCDAILVLIKSDDKSEGMLMELGYAIAKNKKLIAAVNKKVKNTRIRGLAENLIDFKDIEELCNKLKNLK